MKVGGYELIEQQGVWFLLDDDARTAGTLVPQPDGSWRCKAPADGVVTVRVPDGVEDAPAYVAGQVT